MYVRYMHRNLFHQTQRCASLRLLVCAKLRSSQFTIVNELFSPDSVLSASNPFRIQYIQPFSNSGIQLKPELLALTLRVRVSGPNPESKCRSGPGRARTRCGLRLLLVPVCRLCQPTRKQSVLVLEPYYE